MMQKLRIRETGASVMQRRTPLFGATILFRLILRRSARLPLNNPWTLLLLAISAEVIGTSFLRLSEGMTRPGPTVLVFTAYAIAMGLLSKVVMSLPLGLTYALWSGIGTAAIVLVGRFAYQQMMGVGQLIGIALITAGVVLVNLKQ
jgi:small multidrug resistance pump